MAGLATLATPAGALPVGGGDPPDTTDRADLKITSLTVGPSGGNWSIGYTVANAGGSAAAASKLALSGGTQISVPSLAAGATRSGTVQMARTQCYIILSAVADSTGVVRESNEGNNTRRAVGVVPPCPPRYQITATSFKALDESGIDASGSDEPYWIFSSVGSSGTASSKASQVFGGIDSGDTQAFGLADSCVWGCGGAGAEAPVGVGLNVQLWESDLGHVDDTLYDVAQFFQDAGPILSSTGVLDWVGQASTVMGDAMEFILDWADDDLFGSATYAHSADQLASALPSRGMSFSDTRTYQNGDAKYTLTMSVSRII